MRNFKPIPKEPVQPTPLLQDDEWAQLRAAFDGDGIGDDAYRTLLIRLQGLRNAPTPASELFQGCGGNISDNGQGWMNFRFGQMRLPFRLATMGTFGPRDRGRLLAMKRVRK